MENHFAWRRGNIFTDLESVVVGHPDFQFAVAALEIVEHVFQAIDQVLAAAIDGFAQHLRIGRDEIGRRQRVDELAGVEIDLLGGLRVQAINLGDRLGDQRAVVG